jgi:hypothetical protein
MLDRPRPRIATFEICPPTREMLECNEVLGSWFLSRCWERAVRLSRKRRSATFNKSRRKFINVRQVYERPIQPMGTGLA